MTTRTMGRRAVLEGFGVGALGLAGAALLGCGSAGGGTGGVTEAGQKAASSIGASSGGGLPMTAPKVTGKVREGGTFTAANTATYVQHDPGTALGANIWHLIGEKGLEPDPVTMAVRPHVFTSWEVADPTGTTLIFKMNPNLFIHNKAPWNGRQFTAEDAAWNLERIGGLYAERLKIPLTSFQRASMVEGLTKAQAVDPLTVKVTLSKPNSSFFNGLMDTRVPFAPKEMDDIGWTDPLKMGGIGPWQVTEWIKDQRTVFKKNPTYEKFRPGEPHFDEYRTVTVPDAAATQAAFVSGQTQTYGVTSIEQLDNVRKAKPDANLYTWIDSNWNHLRPNFTFGPFKDYRVRKALFLAMDRKAINDGLYGPGWGYQLALNPGFPEAWALDRVGKLPGMNPDTKAADIAEAGKLLTAAGFTGGKGLDFEILCSGTTNHVENATRFQGQMKTAFPDMKVTFKPSADSPSFAVPQAEGRFQMIAYVITAAPDAVIDMASQYRTGGSRNYGAHSNPAADSILDKAFAELKPEARTKLMDEFQQKFYDEWMPMFVLCANPVKTLVQGNIAGYDALAGTWFGYSATTKVNRLYYVDK